MGRQREDAVPGADASLRSSGSDEGEGDANAAVSVSVPQHAVHRFPESADKSQGEAKSKSADEGAESEEGTAVGGEREGGMVGGAGCAARRDLQVYPD